MKNKRLLASIVRPLSDLDSVKAIFLYGSFARGDYGPRSDIDILIISKKKDERIQDAVIGIKSDRDIQPLIRTEEELLASDSGLIQNIMREGKILYLKEPLELDVARVLRLKPYVIFCFGLDGLNQKEKARLNRTLYARKQKGYDYPGILSESGGRRLSDGAIILPQANIGPIEKEFRRYGVKHSKELVWR